LPSKNVALSNRDNCFIDNKIWTEPFPLSKLGAQLGCSRTPPLPETMDIAWQQFDAMGKSGSPSIALHFGD
jgi:hypothetical protein